MFYTKPKMDMKVDFVSKTFHEIQMSRTIQASEKLTRLQLYRFRLIDYFDFFSPSQQFFSYVGTGLPGLNKY